MFNFSIIIITLVLCMWVFGTLQRFFVLKKYGQEISSSDYLHTAISLSLLGIPAIYFYYTGNLYAFLAGFTLAWAVSTVSSILVSLPLMPYLTKHPINQQTLAVYSVFLYAPITMVMIAVSIYLGSPFALGAALATAASWTGYTALLNKA